MNSKMLYVGGGLLIIMGLVNSVLGVVLDSYIPIGLALLWIGLAQK